MNIYNKISSNQSGIALIIFLSVMILGAATFFLAGANDNRFQREINAQKQTAIAMRQAKDALLGFAAVYAETHSGQPQGYLPCPDLDGDGSSDILGTYCGNEGKSMLGRFPWRTLGLPPLRDGNGDCLWYAVSGNYKDKTYLSPTRKFPLTSDTPGLFVVEDGDGNKIAGAGCSTGSCSAKEIESQQADQAIAIIFSPGKMLKGQSRTLTASNKTICGSTNDSDNIVQASNYLDTFKVKASYNIDNSNGTKNTSPTEINTVFIKTPLTYSTNNSNGNSKIKKEIFNDKLMLITRKDFAPIYERMDFWVAKQVSSCLEQVSGSSYREHFFQDSRSDGGFLEAIGNWKDPEDGTFRAEDAASHDVKNYINSYVDDKVLYCKAICDRSLTNCNDTCDEVNDCKLDCDGDTDCEKDCGAECDECIQINVDCKSADKGCDREGQKESHRRNAIELEQIFPWVAAINDTSCLNIEHEDTSYLNVCQTIDGNRFGRIPNIPNDVDNGMLTEWPSKIPITITIKCFNNFWWDKWKEKVFYAIDSDYTPGDITHFWIKTVRKIWDDELWSNYKTRRDNIKVSTFARIKPSDKMDWEFVSIPISSVVDTLQVDTKNAYKFVIFVAGQRLGNQTRSDNAAKTDIANYLEGQNILDFQYYLDDDICPVDANNSSPSPLACKFERKRTDDSFNDIICKDKKADCIIPK